MTDSFDDTVTEVLIGILFDGNRPIDGGVVNDTGTMFLSRWKNDGNRYLPMITVSIVIRLTIDVDHLMTDHDSFTFHSHSSR